MKKVLIAPLNWGLGHAVRCIPIIRYLLDKKTEPLIAADGRPLELLKKEFPLCRFLLLPGYNISYPVNGSMTLKIASQVPKILAGISREHAVLEKIIRKEKIDAVISDNRFGLWTKEIPCAFITHQLMIKSPFGEKIICELNKKYISRYNECWIPDVKGANNLSGDLSHKYPPPLHSRFIGVLSRFSKPEDKPVIKRKLLVILSGPEPQRTVFEKKIIEQISSNLSSSFISPSVLIIQGITEKNEHRKIAGNIEIISCLPSAELQNEILSSEIILSRSGYSTIMDLAVLQKKAIFIPTPGQTEQEYLAAYCTKNKIAYSVSQKDFNLITAIKESENYSGFTHSYPISDFKQAVDSFLKLENRSEVKHPAFSRPPQGLK